LLLRFQTGALAASSDLQMKAGVYYLLTMCPAVLETMALILETSSNVDIFIV